MKTKNIILITTIFSTLIACGRRPDVARAERVLFQKKNTFSVFSASGKTLETEMRAATLLIYPEPQDLEGFEFDPSKVSTSSDWSLLLSRTTNGSRYQTVFSKSESGFDKAKKMARLIFSSGQTRDEALRFRADLEKKVADEETKVYDSQSTQGITANSFKPYVCYYEADGYVYTDDVYKSCLIAKTDTHSRKKQARDCILFSKFQFDDGQLDAAGLDLMDSCKKLTGKLSELTSEYKTYNNVRTAGENVVLDLLLEAEKNAKRIFAMTASNTDKPDSSGGPHSVLRFNVNQTKVHELRLYVEFLGDLGISSRHEYSYCDDTALTPCNGKISEPVIFTGPRGTKRMKFTVTMPDLVIQTEGDLTYEEGVMGYRYVDSEAFYTYTKDGSLRRGVVKFELNAK